MGCGFERFVAGLCDRWVSQPAPVSRSLTGRGATLTSCALTTSSYLTIVSGQELLATAILWGPEPTRRMRRGSYRV
jgi:hypothetical protein